MNKNDAIASFVSVDIYQKYNLMFYKFCCKVNFIHYDDNYRKIKDPVWEYMVNGPRTNKR